MPPPFTREPAPIDPHALSAWDRVLDDVPLQLRLNKFEVEQAYLAFRELIEAQAHLQQSMIHLSNQNIGFANDAMKSSQASLMRSYDSLNWVLSALMQSAEPRK